MKSTANAILMFLMLVGVPTARADTFGSGANTFNIDFVNIGNPGNAADTTGQPNPAGAVAYEYRIGKYEISEQMIIKASASGGPGIGMMFIRGPNKPATFLYWIEAAKFVNWLNTSTGHAAAYKIEPGAGFGFQLWSPGDMGYDPANQFRNTQARYFLPSADEWYKAAYYDPISGHYWDFPTGSDVAPTPVASGTAAGTAVYGGQYETGPADITLAGGLSPYGTMGQGGNVMEYEETGDDLLNNSNSQMYQRGIRGGHWAVSSDLSFVLSATFRTTDFPQSPDTVRGFRVASTAIPEPSAVLISTLAAGAWLMRKGRGR